MRKFVYIFLFCFLGMTSLLADGKGVEVRPVDKELIESDPKKIVTTVFRVTNKTSAKQEFVSEVELPEGWKLITQDFPFVLGENESDIKLVSFFVPQNTPANKFEVTYRVTGRELPSLSDFYTITVAVLPYRELSAEILQAPEYVIAGEDYQVTFVVINGCNTNDKIDVKIETGQNYPTSCQVEDFPSPFNRSKKVTVTIHTDGEIQKSFKHSVRLMAQLRGDDQVGADVSSYVKIITRTTGVDDRFHRIPTDVALYSVAQGNSNFTSGFQGEVSGKGTLDENGFRYIEFKLRGPDIYDKSMFGLRDEYYVSYWTGTSAIHLGDRHYSLSSLTEKYRYGRGVEGYFQLKGFQLGTFYQRTRWIYPRENQIASYIRYFFKKKHKIGINYLNKNRNNINDSIVSLDGEIKPFKNTTVQFECALGEKEGKTQDAYLAKLTSHQSQFNYMLYWIRASSDFAGYYRDTDFISTSLSLKLLSNFRLNAHILQEKQNFKVDTTNYLTPFTQYYQMGLYYQMKRGTSLTFDWFDKSREDRQLVPQFDYHESLFRFGVNQNVDKFSIHATAESGKTTNELIGKTSVSERYTVSTLFRPASKQSYRGYFYYEKSARYSEERTSRITAGLNLNIRLTDRTSFYLNFQNSHSPEEYYQDRNVFEVRLKQMLFDDHQLSLRGRHTLMRNSMHKKYTTVLLKYEFHFGIPVGHKKNVGVVKGYVFDAETTKPVRDLIVRINGSTAVTNHKGYFIFPSLQPGTYYLSISKIRMGMDRVTTQKTPMEVTVRGGEEVRVDLILTRSATLSGRVMVYNAAEDSTHQLEGERSEAQSAEYYVVGNGNGNGNGNGHKNGNGYKNGNGRKNGNGHKNGNGNGKNGSKINGNGKAKLLLNGSTNNGNGKAKLVPDYGLPEILVEMSRDGEIQRRVTDMEGRFSFEELRPGLWNLKVYEYNLPEYYKLERTTFKVEIKPDEKREVLIKVLPKKRRIRMMQEGGTLFEESKEEVNQGSIHKKPGREAMRNVKKNGEDLMENYDLGLQKYYQREYEEAIQIFRRLLDSNLDSSLVDRCQYFIGECYNALGEYRKAIDAYNAVLQQ